MTRSVPQWIGKNDDTPIPDRVRLRVFMRYNGICQCGCGHKIVTGERWQCDHRLALVNGGIHAETNLVPLLFEHHLHKTAADVALKSQTYRKQKSHYGLKKSKRSMPGSRNSPWKRRMDGTIVKR